MIPLVALLWPKPLIGSFGLVSRITLFRYRSQTGVVPTGFAAESVSILFRSFRSKRFEKKQAKETISLRIVYPFFRRFDLFRIFGELVDWR